MHPILQSHCESGVFSHGYLLIGRDEGCEAARTAASYLLNTDITGLHSHPDFLERSFEQFGINDAHQLRRAAWIQPSSGAKKVALLIIKNITQEAINALLKLFEEPSKSTHFFVVVDSEDAVSSTLRSRLTVLNCKKSYEIGKEYQKIAERFLTMTTPQRLNWLKKIKDKNEAAEFLTAIEIALRSKMDSTRVNPHTNFGIAHSAHNEVNAKVGVGVKRLRSQKGRFLF